MKIFSRRRHQTKTPTYGEPYSPSDVYRGPLPNPSDLPPAATPPSSSTDKSWRSAASTILLFVSAFLIAILLNSFVIQSYQVDGQSMENTLQNNDRLIVNKIPRTISRITGHAYTPHRGDIIIFNKSGLPGFIGQKQLVKRVIGLPGERVIVAGGKITIYNSAYPDGFNPDISSGYHIDATSTIGNGSWQLKQNEIFVCGDNRSNSEDSRYFGPISSSSIVAKLVLRILPLSTVKSY